MRTTDSEDRIKLAARLARVADDLSRGRIISCDTPRLITGGREGHAIIRGSKGPRVKITFIMYSSGGISVTGATASRDYFGGRLNWDSSVNHSRSADISSVFHTQLNSAARGLKLEEVAKMPRLLRWWYLRTN